MIKNILLTSIQDIRLKLRMPKSQKSPLKSKIHSVNMQWRLRYCYLVLMSIFSFIIHFFPEKVCKYYFAEASVQTGLRQPTKKMFLRQIKVLQSMKGHKLDTIFHALLLKYFLITWSNNTLFVNKFLPM